MQKSNIERAKMMKNIKLIMITSLIVVSCGRSENTKNDLRAGERKNANTAKAPESENIELAAVNLSSEQNFTVVTSSGANKKLKDYFSKNYLIVGFDDDHCEECTIGIASSVAKRFENLKSSSSCSLLILTSRDQLSGKAPSGKEYLQGIHASPLSIIKRFKATDLAANSVFLINRNGTKVNTSPNADDLEKVCN